MNMYRCLGSIKSINAEILHNGIKGFVPNIKGRPRLFGYDIELESEELTFYINTYDEKEYKVDISTIGKEKLFLLLEPLKELLIKSNSKFDLIYFREDTEGNQVSEDYIYFQNLA